MSGELSKENECPLTLSKDETAYFSNILNETLNGLQLSDFESQMQTSRRAVTDLWKKFETVYNAYSSRETQVVAFSPEEIQALLIASRVCVKELGEEEFSTRVGESIAYAKRRIDVLSRLSSAKG